MQSMTQRRRNSLHDAQGELPLPILAALSNPCKN